MKIDFNFLNKLKEKINFSGGNIKGTKFSDIIDFGNIDIKEIENIKFNPNSIIINNKSFNLANNNSFFVNNINPKALKYNFKESGIDIDEYFEEEIKIYYKNFSFNNKFIKGKPVITNFNTKNIKEKGNLIIQELMFKNNKIKIFSYMYKNQKLIPGIIKIKRTKDTYDNILTEIGGANLLKEFIETDIDTNQNYYLFPLNATELNIYDIKIFLQEYLLFLLETIYSVFFLNNSSFLDYYKSIAVDLNNLIHNLEDNDKIKEKILKIVNSTSITPYIWGLKKGIYGYFNSTLYYFFIEKRTSKGKELFPIYVYPKQIIEKDEVFLLIYDYIPIGNHIKGLSHTLIIKALDRYLTDKSFIYNNTFRKNLEFIGGNLSYFDYNNLNNLKKIIKIHNFIETILIK